MCFSFFLYYANHYWCRINKDNYMTFLEKKNINSLYIIVHYPTPRGINIVNLYTENIIPAFRGPCRFQHPF